MRLKKRSFTVFEFLLICCLIFGLIGIFLNYAGTVLRISREQALRNELSSIRMSIEHFQLVNGRPPKDLQELANKPLTIWDKDSIISQKKFIEHYNTDKQGNFIDPFKNKYVYDERSGRVSSGTRGFESW